MDENEKYFENEELNRLFNNWLAGDPTAPLNASRMTFTQFVLSAIESGINVELADFQQGFKDYKLSTPIVDFEHSYFQQYEAMKDMYNLIKHGSIK
ncbi:hypothetical protein AGMMS4957_19640 [Bacteroidia bacterium]|nr:hypothetical protein AGMMS4957_19640 [Bacteroidia bacterium]